MTEIGVISVRKRRSRQEIKRLVAEFETSGLRRSEFCQKHNLALGTLRRGLRRRRMEAQGQSEGKRLVEVCSASRYFRDFSQINRDGFLALLTARAASWGAWARPQVLVCLGLGRG